MHFNSFNRIKMKIEFMLSRAIMSGFAFTCQISGISWIPCTRSSQSLGRKIGQTSRILENAFSSNYAVVDNKCANNNKSITHEKHVVRKRFFDFIIFVIAFMMMFCCSHHAVADYGIVRKNGNAPFACALRNSVLSVHVEYWKQENAVATIMLAVVVLPSTR